MIAFDCLEPMVLCLHDGIVQAILCILPVEELTAVIVLFSHEAAPKPLYANDLRFKFRIVLCHLREILDECSVHQHRRSVHFLDFDVAMQVVDAVDGDSLSYAVLLSQSELSDGHQFPVSAPPRLDLPSRPFPVIQMVNVDFLDLPRTIMGDKF